MPFCEKCGKEIKDGDRFCEHCGAEVKSLPMTLANENPTSIKSDKKSNKKLVVIISAASAVAAVLAVCAIVFVPKMFRNNENEQYKPLQTIEITTQQETTQQPSTVIQNTTEPESIDDGSSDADDDYYDDDDYILPDSGTRKLTNPDLAGLDADELELARNEIYARAGRRFNTDYIQDYFDDKWWYVGTIEPEDFTEDMLNDVEKYNVNFIRDYEKNYTE
ncbi:MAG: YARHG domain-containing protein [Clostridia bacterium]|nr:YARHG domain-containing protein [Clostridia bacterium]